MRLGRIKALEILNGQSLIERTVDCLYSLSRSVLVITSQEQFEVIAASRLRGKVIVDLCPGRGVLGGIYTGLASTDSCYSLVVGCDMPFLNRNLLRYLIGLAPGFDLVVPRVDGMYEPLHAVYSRSCLAPVTKLMEQNNLGISKLFDIVNTRYVDKGEIAKFDPQFLSFFNVNTLYDLGKAKEIMKQSENSLMTGKEYPNCD